MDVTTEEGLKKALTRITIEPLRSLELMTQEEIDYECFGDECEQPLISENDAESSNEDKD